MGKLHTLWVDLLVAAEEGDVPPGFRKHCDTVYCPDAEMAAKMLDRQRIDLVCFDFDYPDRTRLRLLRELKSRCPSVPIIMLTVQHSEPLAIWAFRNRVWDYLVKPVAQHEAERCLTAVAAALAYRTSQSPRTVAANPEKIPDEIAFTAKRSDQSLAAAIYFVEQNFRSRIRADEVAAVCKISPIKFSRLFKETYGVTFRDYLVTYRLKEACRLLENPGASVADVAFAVGFQDPSYFTRLFRERMGVTPSVVVGHTIGSSASEPVLELTRLERPARPA